MLETKRLRMEPISEYDLECLEAFYSDPDCTRFVPSLSVPIDELIQNRKRHWSKHGFGTYSVKLKSNEIIGYCGIEYTADSSDTDLRFGLVKSAWGNGGNRDSFTENYGFNRSRSTALAVVNGGCGLGTLGTVSCHYSLSVS